MALPGIRKTDPARSSEGRRGAVATDSVAFAPGQTYACGRYRSLKGKFGLDTKKGGAGPMTIPSMTSVVPPSFNVPSYLQPQVNLSLGSPVLPGQPISLSWSYNDPLVDLSVGTATANFFLSDLNQPTPGNIQINAQPWEVNVSTPSGGTGVYTNNQSGFLVSQNQTIANLLYAVGSKLIQLQLSVTGTDTSGSPYNQTYVVFATLVVIPEDIDSTWRQWVTQSPLGVQWNTPYQLTAQINNRSQFATMTVNQLIITQTDSAGNQITTPVSPPPPISPQKSQSFPMGAPLTQAWQWMDPIDYLTIGATSKTFQYAFNWQITDNFGNLYPAVLFTLSQAQQANLQFIGSGQLLVGVSVSQDKLAWQTAALVWLVIAGVLTIAQAIASVASAIAGASGGSTSSSGTGLASVVAAVGGGFFGFFGWVSNAVAQGDADNAKDPPAPDYNCREVVSVRAPVFELPGGRHPRLRALKKFFDTVAFASSAQVALYATEGKIAGAKLAKDTQGERIQRRSLNRIRMSMRKSGPALKRSYPQARRVMASILEAYESTLRTGVALIKRNGLSNGIRSELLEKRIPVPVIEMGIALAKSGRLDDPVSFLLASFDKVALASEAAVRTVLQAKSQSKINNRKASRT
jgi:hypothetical protein